MVVVTVMMLLAWNLPPILIAIPIIFELRERRSLPVSRPVLQVQIQDGFYYRTNLRGRYYRYKRRSGLPPRRVRGGSTAPRYNRKDQRTTFYDQNSSTARLRPQLLRQINV